MKESHCQNYIKKKVKNLTSSQKSEFESGRARERQMTASATLTQLFTLNGVRNDEGMQQQPQPQQHHHHRHEKHNIDAVITTASIKSISNSIRVKKKKTDDDH